MILISKSSQLVARRYLLALLSALLVFGIGGCGDKPEAPQTSAEPAASPGITVPVAEPTSEAAWSPEQEQALRRRVEAYWEATKSRDFSSTFQMLANAQPRGSLDPANYYRKSSNAMKVIGYRIESVRPVAPGHAQVAIRYSLGLESLGEVFPIDKEANDDWTLIDGEWYMGKPLAAGSKP